MPKIHVPRQYHADSYYHIFSRGLRKEAIFRSDKDYWIFRRYLKAVLRERSGSISLVAYALLENHYHLLIHQKSERAFSSFMKSLIARYRMFIKEKYLIDGPYFEGTFKAIYLPHREDVERERTYILRNPIVAGLKGWKHVGFDP